jgi:hypothetical protein
MINGQCPQAQKKQKQRHENDSANTTDDNENEDHESILKITRAGHRGKTVLALQGITTILTKGLEHETTWVDLQSQRQALFGQAAEREKEK